MTLNRLARLLLCSAFLVSGIVKLIHFPAATAEVGQLTGIAAPSALDALTVLVIITQIGGSLLVVFSDRFGWAGALIAARLTARLFVNDRG